MSNEELWGIREQNKFWVRNDREMQMMKTESSLKKFKGSPSGTPGVLSVSLSLMCCRQSG